MNKWEEEFEDLKDFVSDIIVLNNNYYTGNAPYYPEDLEFDFMTMIEKWSKKIDHYKWGGKKNEHYN